MKWYYWVLAFIAVLAAASTALPFTPGDTPECFLGYQAHCSFTPVSTLICLGIAGGVLFLGWSGSKNEADDDEDEDDDDT